MDDQCKVHDKRYDSKGRWNSMCDVQFVHNIARNFGKIRKLGTRSRNYAIAAILLFFSKVGGTSVLKVQYPILAPFLP